MNHKEKAKELYEKYWQLLLGDDVRVDVVKKCAQLAADEIINAIDELEDKTIFINGTWHDGGSEWLKVKEEIEKL